MSDAHKEALAEGRRQGHAVRRYLDALEQGAVSGSRPADEIGQELDEVCYAAQQAGIIERLELVQRRLNLEEERRLVLEGPDLKALEAEFIEVARSYSDRKGITFDVWMDLGVPERVLRDAGIATDDA